MFRHWPLTYHKFAQISARVAECAGDQGKFFEMHDLLFVKQDSLGLKDWAEFANESGVADSVRFADCTKRTDSLDVVMRDVAAVKELGATGTPVVVINGLRYTAPPSLEDLRTLIEETARTGP